MLPDVIEQFATIKGRHMGCDPAGLAMTALAVCAAAIPDGIKVQMLRYDKGWCEAARLWVALIGPPSAKKSPILNAAAKPLREIDRHKVQLWRSRWAEWNALDKTQKAATPEPLQSRKLVEDTTVEALQEALRGSPDGVLCFRDELSGWLGSMEKYSGKGGAADRSVWLSSFNGGGYTIDRIGRGGAITVPNLSVSLVGGIQPDSIRKVAADAVDDGLLQRMFPIVLRSTTVGEDVPMPPAQANYEVTVHFLVHVRPPRSGTLQFDDEAQAIRRKLETRHSYLQALELLNPKLASHIGKLDGLFGRLCVIWHAIENYSCPDGLPEIINGDIASRVADFMTMFLLPHSVAFYAGTLGFSNDHDRLKAVAAYIVAHRLTKITVRDIARGDRSMRRLTKQDVLPILEQLTALGWLAEEPGPRATSDPVYIVNPIVHSLFAERAAHEQARRDAAKAALAEMFGRK
ncbi:hypothetical protein BG36_06375 [Aquamicrobium defluvii]|uniref:DUF3987 domain-containing protein n=1 Tax=Aquamicrobium defluvii TaxID=69279 RepID=A0A011TRH0_9HYPH|nr:hypothetical protein BG36_06375 [Aquamicrobium defluvii]